MSEEEEEVSDPDWKEVLAFAKLHWPQGTLDTPDYQNGWRSEEELLSMIPHYWSADTWWRRECRPLYESLKRQQETVEGNGIGKGGTAIVKGWNA